MTKEQFQEICQNTFGAIEVSERNGRPMVELIRQHDPALARIYNEMLDAQLCVATYIRERIEQRRS